jgi:archaellum biogenesis protein FlaJ (TadC family)
MLNFIQQHGQWFALISFTVFIASLFIVPALLIRIPADYFCHHNRHTTDNKHPLIKLVISIAKNILGSILVIVGFLMMFIPGPGLLTFFIGMMIMNYPGKYTLERWLIIKLRGLSAINWYRNRHDQPPLLMPDEKS